MRPPLEGLSKTSKLGRAAALISGVIALSVGPAAQAADLRLLTGFNSTQKPTHAVLERYLANVKALGAGSVRITVAGPEVVSIFDQLQPVSSGVFDMLHTHPVFHAGSGWNKLDAKTQRVLLDAGKKTELEWLPLGDAIHAEEDAELAKRGVAVVQMAPPVAAKLHKAFNDSIWKLGADCCRDEAAALCAMALKAGLTQ